LSSLGCQRRAEEENNGKNPIWGYEGNTLVRIERDLKGNGRHLDKNFGGKFDTFGKVPEKEDRKPWRGG